VAVEREAIALAPHVVVQRSHACGVGELRAEVVQVAAEEADVQLPREAVGRDDRAAIVVLDHRQARRGERAHARRIVEVVPVRAPQLAAVLASKVVQPSRVVAREFADPAALVDVVVQVEATGREPVRLRDPLAPLPVREIAVEVQVDALARELGDVMWVQADRPSRHDRVPFAVVVGQSLRAFAGEPVALRQVAVEHELRACVGYADRVEPLRHFRRRVDAAVGLRVEVDELAPRALLEADERAFLEMPHERDAGIAPQHFVRERHRLPVEERVDHVGLDARDLVAPARPVEILAVRERQRADRVVPVWVAHPQAEQSMAAFLERDHAIGVVRELAHEQDAQPVGRRRGTRSLAIMPVLLDLVDQVAGSRVEAQRRAHAIAQPIRIDAALGLADHLVPLLRMIDPFARQRAGRHERAALAELRPEHARQVVGDQFVAGHPAIVGAPMRDLHELEPVTVDQAFRGAAVVMAHVRIREDGAGVAAQRREQPREVVAMVEVVGRQVRDDRRRRVVERGVQRRTESAVLDAAVIAQA
jgi:hypothetical protein